MGNQASATPSSAVPIRRLTAGEQARYPAYNFIVTSAIPWTLNSGESGFVPPGFLFDGCSVPLGAHVWWPNTVYCAVHDWLYATHPASRWESDYILPLHMRFPVRFFGSGSWYVSGGRGPSFG